MSVVVDTGLTSRAIIGRFYRRLEEFAEAAWWTKLAMHFSSNQQQETYKWLGMVPQVREWVGGRQVKPLRSQGVTIVNKVWESTIRVDSDELRRDKTGQVMVRVNEMARRVATHPNKLLTELISNGASGTAYDGAIWQGFNFEARAGNAMSECIDLGRPGDPLLGEHLLDLPDHPPGIIVTGQPGRELRQDLRVLGQPSPPLGR